MAAMWSATTPSQFLDTQPMKTHTPRPCTSTSTEPSENITSSQEGYVPEFRFEACRHRPAREGLL